MSAKVFVFPVKESWKVVRGGQTLSVHRHISTALERAREVCMTLSHRPSGSDLQIKNACSF